MARHLACGDHLLSLDGPRVMGILNVTPDSFSDGGRFLSRDAALRQAWHMVEAGADLVDVGGESTRPGARGVSEAEELSRVVPVIEALAKTLPVPVSVDTRTPAVMRAAADAGAGMINDVCALRGDGALAAAQQTGLPVCLMHMQGEPRTMQTEPRYKDVVAEVRGFLELRIHACLRAEIPRERLLVDPGFGFGKQLAHNLSLLRHLDQLVSLGPPLLVGISRKSMIGQILGGRPVEQRLYGSLAAAVVAALAGARILRVHDVGPTVDALKVIRALHVDERGSGY